MTDNNGAWAPKGARRYEYSPGLMDMCDPNVITGEPIKGGAIVVVVKRIGRALAWIRDKHSNVQSVWSRALVPLKAVKLQGRTYYAYCDKGE